MKKLWIFAVLYMLSMSNIYAGISVCYNQDNTVKGFSLRGSQIQNCDYYDAGQNVTQAKYDTVRNLLISIPMRYLKKLGNDPVQMSPAEQVTVDDAIAATVESQYRTGQKANFNGPRGVYLRAFADITKDEINLLRAWITSFKVEVASASNLADLKTRVAVLPNTPPRTLAQLKTAIQTKIDGKVVDE